MCLFLGVGALAAIGTLTGAIRGELDAQGREILGGDLEVEVWQRPLNDEESAFLARYGTLSRGFRMQAMASAGEAATPVELKAVDANWPMYGRLTLAGRQHDGRAAAGHRPGSPKAPPSGSGSARATASASARATSRSAGSSTTSPTGSAKASSSARR